ncbi:MAG: hypothetical protein WCK48_02150 [bacterium]
MKKVFAYIGIAVILLAFFVPVLSYSQVIPINTSATPQAQQARSDQQKSSNSSTGFVADILLTVLGWIGYLLMSFMAWVLGLLGILLNYVLNYTVVKMAENLSLLPGINVAWKVIRDIMNIAFIFILVYESIKRIIGVEHKDAKKFIVGIVMASLLINFSLFFTKVLIDASNVVTVGVYNSIIGPEALQNNKGLANAFQGAMGLQGLYATDKAKFAAQFGGSDFNVFMIGTLAAILFLVTSVVFFAVSVMFIIRYFVLVFLLALSPIGYMGIALDFMKKYQGDWWDALMGQLTFAPLYMLMTWVVLTLMSGLTSSMSITPAAWSSITNSADLAASASATANPSSSPIGILVNFAMVIGFIILSLSVAKTQSTKGNKLIGQATNWATAAAGGALLGGAAFAGRQTAGRLALRGTSVDELEAKAAAGDKVAATRLSLAKSTFDVRKTGVMETASKVTGVNLGKGLPFNEKAGEGGRAAAAETKKKETNANLDKVVDSYVKKRDFVGLSEAIKKNGDLKEQQYMYKKLSERDRISVDKALGDPALTEKLREKLPIDEQIKMHSNAKDWAGLLKLYKSKKTDSEKDYIYEKLSPRDRVEFEKALTDDGLTADVTARRDALSVEEQEKTEEAKKKAKKEQAQKDRQDDIDNIVNGRPVTIAGATLDTLIGPVGGNGPKLPVKETRELSAEARKNPDVVRRLSVPHLRDLKANGSLEQDEIDAILSTITDPTPYASQASHLSYINQATEKTFWNP